MDYVYNDEDNAPMIDDPYDGPHNPTVYLSRAEERYYESGQYRIDEERKNWKPDDGCWNCMHFDWNHEACTLNWNNMDESYYNPDMDDRKLDDYCDDHETDPDADWEEIFGGNEP